MESQVVFQANTTSIESLPQRIIQLPIDLTPMVALAYLYHGSSEFYIEDIFALSESSEHPLNFGSMMNLVSGSDEANLCYSKIGQEEPTSPEMYRELHNSFMPFCRLTDPDIWGKSLRCKNILFLVFNKVVNAELSTNKVKIAPTFPSFWESNPQI